jgi:hypothetical protein
MREADNRPFDPSQLWPRAQEALELSSALCAQTRELREELRDRIAERRRLERASRARRRAMSYER